MKLTLARPLKSVMTVFGAVVLIALAQGSARADEVFISGFTVGGLQSPMSGFTFEGSSFAHLTSNGGLNLNIGTITIGSGVDLNALNGKQFTLAVTFTSPLGIGGSTQAFVLPFTGTVDTSSGDFLIDFGTSAQTQTFNFFNSTGAGSFDFPLTIDFVFIDLRGGQNQQTINASIGNASLNPFPIVNTPEPATFILLASGLAGAAGAARRRGWKGRS
jgi:hypothetical protein